MQQRYVKQTSSLYSFLIFHRYLTKYHNKHTSYITLWNSKRLCGTINSSLMSFKLNNNNNNNSTVINTSSSISNKNYSSLPDEECNASILSKTTQVLSSIKDQKEDKEEDKISLTSNENKKEKNIFNRWNMQEMLFFLKDYHTNIVTYLNAEDRIKQMNLLDDWMITKLFNNNNEWINKLQVNGEKSPQYQIVVGEYKILRYLLHRFISDKTIWQDELLELLQLVISSNSKYLCKDENNEIESLIIPDNLFRGPEKMNFYSIGVQDILWKFLFVNKSSFNNPNALWHAFIIYNRNIFSLPSPQRPPFNSYESYPTLTEAEFDLASIINNNVNNNDNNKYSEKLTRGVTLHWPEEWKPTSEVEELTKEGNNNNNNSYCNYYNSEDINDIPIVDDERRTHYARDEFYMRLVEPSEVELNNNNNNNNNNSHHMERGLLNPVNGEIEDLQLTFLWDIFQKMKVEDTIDIYRVLCENFEKFKKEVFIDIISRKGLLLIFFARDEVRALTPPLVTYQRLRRLHEELIYLSEWMLSSFNNNNNIDNSNNNKPKPPRLFKEISKSSQISFSCFAQIHAPIYENFYRILNKASSPAELYNFYCECCKSFNIEENNNNNNSNNNNEKIKEINKNIQKFPPFEYLNILQQMAFQYPFENKTHFPSEYNSTKDVITSSTLQHTPKVNNKMESNNFSNESSINIMKSVEISKELESHIPVIRKRGRPRKIVPPQN